MFRVHNVSQWPNLRHLGESLKGAEGLLEAVSFKKATKGMGRGSVANARWEWVPDCGGCNTKTTGGKGSANTKSRQQVGVCRACGTACGSVVIKKGVEAECRVSVQYLENNSFVNSELGNNVWEKQVSVVLGRRVHTHLGQKTRPRKRHQTTQLIALLPVTTTTTTRSSSLAQG